MHAFKNSFIGLKKYNFVVLKNILIFANTKKRIFELECIFRKLK